MEVKLSVEASPEDMCTSGRRRGFGGAPRLGCVLSGSVVREYVAEYIGTVVLAGLGTSCVAHSVVHKEVGGGPVIASVGYGGALALAILVAGPTSGGHVNPVITIANAVFRGFPWPKVPGFILAQLLGALTGCAIAYLVHSLHLAHLVTSQLQLSLDLPSSSSLAQSLPLSAIFASYPLTTNVVSFTITTLATGAMLLGITAIADPRNQAPPPIFAALVGLLATVLGLAFPGYPLNPACDVMGRLLTTTLLGWGPAAAATPFYPFIAITAPIFGALLGVLVYDLIAPPSAISTTSPSPLT